VRFTVMPGGQVSEAAVVKGSGFRTLDAAALRLLQGAKLPAPGIEATRTVRIRFRLRD
jgi:TonB family protein